jgi:hypothetical protein
MESTISAVIAAINFFIVRFSFGGSVIVGFPAKMWDLPALLIYIIKRYRKFADQLQVFFSKNDLFFSAHERPPPKCHNPMPGAGSRASGGAVFLVPTPAGPSPGTVSAVACTRRSRRDARVII